MIINFILFYYYIDEIANQRENKRSRYKKKKKKRSPLSEKYTKFLKHENIKITPVRKVKPTKLEDIKINVIKSPTLSGGNDDVKTPICKRKRVKMKDGQLNQEAIKHNKKCEGEVEKEQVKKLKPKEVKKRDKRDKRDKRNKKSKMMRKRRLSKRHTRGRRISLKNPSKKDKNVEKTMQKAKKMSDESIKQELLKSGIVIKGNQKQLMRDIYVFSNLGGIKIHKE